MVASRRRAAALLIVIMLLLSMPLPALSMSVSTAFSAAQSLFYATALSFAPILLTALLALLLKSLSAALVSGIVFASLLSSNGNGAEAVRHVTRIASERIGSYWTIAVLCFIVMLGMLAVILQKAAVGEAYARLAGRICRTRLGVLLATLCFHLLLYFEETFGSDTVGGEMSQVTDRHHISRAKLAYLAAQAAPLGILMPVSALSAAISAAIGPEPWSYALFLRTIPYNLYGITALGIALCGILLRFDFGAMRRHEAMAQKGDLFGGTGNEYPSEGRLSQNKQTGVADLTLPTLSLAFFCLLGIAHMGGFMDGNDFFTTLQEGDVALGLLSGAFYTICFCLIFLYARGILRPHRYTGTLVAGFRRVAPLLLILFFSWVLAGLCVDSLGADEFLSRFCDRMPFDGALVPALLFIVSTALGFCTGTSWGTFSMLIPPVVAAFRVESAVFPEIAVLCVSACLSGAAGGGQLSPLSLTTRSTAAGARCGLSGHSSTMRPYIVAALAFSFVGYLCAGFVANPLITVLCTLALLAGTMLLLRFILARKQPFTV